MVIFRESIGSMTLFSKPRTVKIHPNIEIKFFDPCFAEIYFQAICKPESTRDLFLQNLQLKYDSLQKVENRIHDAISEKFEKDGTPDFFIFFENEIAGVFEFHPFSCTESVEIGFWLFPKFRRKSILTKIMPAMMEFARERYSIERVMAATEVGNIGAQKLLAKCGFRQVRQSEYIDPKTGLTEMLLDFEFQL